MRAPTPILLLVLIGSALLARCPTAHGQVIRTVKDLKEAIYTDMAMDQGGDACVRLLNAKGTVGCAAPQGQTPVQGRLLSLDALKAAPADYPDGAVYLLAPALLADFLLQCDASPELQQKVRGVLVQPQPPPAYSQADPAPLSQFALYQDRSYPWNPTGKGLNSLTIPFPVFLLDNTTALDAVQRAAYNEEQNMSGALHYARMHLHMDATGNSSACIQAGTCLPVGGHSVLAALPPLPPTPAAGPGADPSAGDAASTSMPAVWVLSQMDSVSLFHEATAGADSPVSGLIAMLAAAQLLGSFSRAAAAATSASASTPPLPPYRRRLVFAALNGEPWGLMGSKRMLWEAAAGNSSMAGLPVTQDSIAGVVEVTQVGRARGAGSSGGSSSSTALFAHYPTNSSAGSSGSSGGRVLPPFELLEALQSAAGGTSEGPGPVSVSVASPGAGREAGGELPPTASASSFARVAGRGVPAVLLSGFDTAFQGSTFQSHYDSMDSVDADSIATSAVVLARAVHQLALGGDSSSGGSGSGNGGGSGGSGAGDAVATRSTAAAQQLPVDYAAVKANVDELMQCLLNSSLGLNCPLAKSLMSPVSGGHVAHYVGVLRTITADPQTPDAAVKSDYERFVWNYLAFALAPHLPANHSSSFDSGTGGSSGSVDDLQRCQPMNATGCPPGFVCAGSRSIHGPEGQGYCLSGAVRYVPSYSTALYCDGCNGSEAQAQWKLSSAAAEWGAAHGWPADPVWTESNWPSGTPGLTLYLREAGGVEMALLGAGLAVAAASLAAALGLREAYHRKLKRQ